MERRTFNAASYSLSHLRRDGTRTATTIVTISITVAFLLLTSSLLFGMLTDGGGDRKAGLLAGDIPGSVDMFTEFRLDQEISGRARNSLMSYLLLTSAMVLMVGFFIMYNTMAISVMERRREIGILRALGLSTKEVMKLFLLEGAMVGFISWIFALFFGTPLILNLASYLINRGSESIFFVMPSMPLALVIGSLLVTMALSTISTYIATIRPVGSSPVAMMRTRI
ncbi:MAG TPA: FtsX-like permease family protein [Euryarchaeota archaeon]|nr:MAG: hypothetical protein B6U90_06695 [Thermoplasmatales archaeon ex4484_6]RLF67900.1 MAG: hypothetical protein DRN57_05125 [Thermoplasmata archaeon]HHD16297.1 FtsX-like permease family protein [Euryarchaeota archaeon]